MQNKDKLHLLSPGNNSIISGVILINYASLERGEKVLFDAYIFFYKIKMLFCFFVVENSKENS